MRLAVLIIATLILAGCKTLSSPSYSKAIETNTSPIIPAGKVWLAGTLKKTPGSGGNNSVRLKLMPLASMDKETDPESIFFLDFDWHTSMAEKLLGGPFAPTSLWNTAEENAAEKPPESPFDSVFLIEVDANEYSLANISVYSHPYTTRAITDYYIPTRYESGNLYYIGALTLKDLQSGRLRTAQIGIQNEYERDVAELRKQYPQLSELPVIEQVLPVSFISPFTTRY